MAEEFDFDVFMMEAEEGMESAIKALKNDLMGIRAGRANPLLLEKIQVDYYGTMTPINQMANVSVPEPRLLTIAPWEKSMLSEIEKAILKSDLGITPNNDGKIIRLVFPELNAERRSQLAKQVSKLGEEAKVVVRQARRDQVEADEEQKPLVCRSPFKEYDKGGKTIYQICDKSHKSTRAQKLEDGVVRHIGEEIGREHVVFRLLYM